jgi:hypothetical protein
MLARRHAARSGAAAASIDGPHLPQRDVQGLFGTADTPKMRKIGKSPADTLASKERK